MDLSKIHDYFQPETVTERVHIVGCGSVGSTIAENLVRCGVINLTLWDFDEVEPHNIVNQMFRAKDEGRNKAEALLDILCEINEDVRVKTKLKTKGWQGENLSGYVFLCVDSVDLRRQIVDVMMKSQNVRAVFDFRTGLEYAQHYAARWTDADQRQELLDSMDFTDAEAQTGAVSACGVVLGVCPTVRAICSIGCANFMNLVRGEKLIKFVMFDPFRCRLTSLSE